MRRTHKHQSSDAGKRGGLTRSSEEGSVMELERRGQTGTEPIQQQEWKTVSEQHSLDEPYDGRLSRTVL